MAVTATGQPVTLEDLTDNEPVWLLEVDMVGVVLRWSDRPRTIDTDDGQPIQYAGGFELEWEQGLSLFDQSAQGVTVPVRGVHTPPGFDVADLIQRGHVFDGARAEVSLWVEGRTYEERRVVVSGRLHLPEYGEPGEPLAFSVSDQPGDERALIPAADAVVNDDTWPDADPAVTGRTYPIVFGRPGFYGPTGATQSSGSPALMTTYTVSGATPTAADLTIAGHLTGAGLAGDDVRIVNLDDGTEEDLASTITADGLGRQVTTVDILGASTLTISQGAEYWACWLPARDAALTSDDGGDGGRAGNLCIYLLEQSTKDYDRAQWRAARGYLNQWSLSGYIDRTVEPYGYLTGSVLPLLPVSLVAGPNGVAPVVWRYDLPRSEIAAHLREGLDVSYLGPVRMQGFDRLANEVRLRYAPRNDTAGEGTDGGQYLRTATVTGRDVAPTDTIWTTQHTRASFVRYGLRSRELSSDIVWQPDTARRVVGWMARAYAHPWRTVEYEARTLSLAALRPGQLVAITHSALAFDEQVAIVQQVRWVGVSARITLLLIQDDVRDPRPTG